MYGLDKPRYGPDPYARPGYGGGGAPYGNYGFSLYECCGPNLIPITAGILLFLVYVLFIPGFAAPYWVSHEGTTNSITTKTYSGLWRGCVDVSNADNTCNDLIDIDGKEDWLEATQGLMITTFITLLLATLLIIYWLCSYSRYFFVKVMFLILLFLSFILSLVGVIVYGANATDGNELDFDWCFYLVDVSTSILLFVPILLLCVPSRESFPDFGPRDRFGFDYPQPMPPPRPMGPPPPRPGGYGPEPIAHIYPSSLPPRGKPYGTSTGYGYPSNAFSSRF